MRLCLDATRFGFGMTEAVEFATVRQFSSVEFSFEPFAAQSKQAAKLDIQERDYLEQVAALCRQRALTVACLNLNFVVNAEQKSSLKQFNLMAAKLLSVAEVLSCPRLSFFLKPGIDDDWISSAAEALIPFIQSCASAGVKPLLRLSTPRQFMGQSLRKWRPMGTQEWRDILAALPELSLSFSPGDCLWQGIDYLMILPAFAAAIEHVEGNDAEINRTVLNDSGLFGPLWWRYRLPGKGQLDWRQLIEALKLNGFNSNLSLHLDDEFLLEPDLEDAVDSSLAFLSPFLES